MHTLDLFFVFCSGVCEWFVQGSEGLFGERGLPWPARGGGGAGHGDTPASYGNLYSMKQSVCAHHMASDNILCSHT